MILCIGDYVQDFYTFGTATRICPEAPVPVVVPDAYNVSAGGVGLVANQLQELGADVYSWHGSMSKKTRIFAGSHLICRLDEDSVKDFEPEPFPDDQLRMCDCIVVSDYGKGAIFPEIAEEICNSGKPIFVDAKNSWEMYDYKYAYWFPNESEYESAKSVDANYGTHIQIIQKRGRHGAKWGEIELAATVSDVVDTTGAGDIFLAAFVYAQMILRLTPTDCLQYANTLAGESCRHIGTYVVLRAYAQSVLYSLQPSLALTQPIPFEDYDSSGEEDPSRPGLFERYLGAGLRKFYSQAPDSRADLRVAQAIQQGCEFEQTPHKVTSIPIASAAESIQLYGSPSVPTDYVKIGEPLTQSPNVIEHPHAHTQAQDLSQNHEQSKPQV